MDDLTYTYTTGTNKLDHVDDAITSIYNTDIDDQNTGNYDYDAIGNLTKDVKESIDNISWTVYGKIKSIKKSNGDSILFMYDALGNRIIKTVKPASGTPTATYYVKDASGNSLSVYGRITNGVDYEYTQKEATIFGSSRLGIRTPNILVKTVRADGTGLSCVSCTKYYWTVDIQHLNGYYARDLNKKMYELNDHLGDARVTVSDRKNTDSTTVLVSYDNFYAFGSEMPGKSYSTNNYRYGFNGQEKDDEVVGSGNSYTAEFWEYSPRLGRRWNIDPVINASQAPYACFNNNPIFFSDPNGDEPGDDKKPYKGGIQVYEAAEAKGEVPGGESKGSQAFKVGDYNVLPNYITNEQGKQEFSHYTASTTITQVKPGGGTEQIQRVDYVFGKNDLQQFKDNSKILGGAANLMFGADSHLAKWQIDMLNGNGGQAGFLKDQWTNPYNLLAAAHMMTSAWPTANKVNLSGLTYEPVAARTAAISDQGVLNYLEKRAPGDWLKVYEAAYLNGKQVEVHYFIHKQTGQYFDSKIKRLGWSEQFTKGGNKVTGH